MQSALGRPTHPSATHPKFLSPHPRHFPPQTNLMALAAGGHSSRDFLRFGTPMQIVLVSGAGTGLACVNGIACMPVKHACWRCLAYRLL